MRTRSTVTGAFDVENKRLKRTRSSCSAGFVTNSTLTTWTGELTTKVIEDVVTPGFYSLLQCGKFLPLNPVDISTVKETRVAGSGDRNYTYSGGCYRSVDTGPSWSAEPWLVALPPIDEDIVDQVVTEAIADSREAVWDALTFAAEMKQTAKLVGRSWRDLNNIARKAATFARESRKNPKEILRVFSAKWLEYRYGWMPIVYDVEDAMKALQRKLIAGDIVTGKSRVVVDLGQSDSSTTYSSTEGHRTSVQIMEGTRTYRGAAYSRVKSNQARWGVDPLITSWELVPYSFVVDWFLGVNTWLHAVSPFKGADLVGSMGSISDQYTQNQQVTILFDAPGMSGSFGGRSTTLEVQHYTRFSHGGGVLPSWNPRLTGVRMIDLAALIYQGRREVMKLLY